jgi:type IV pilus assembly protein PilF
VALLILAGMGVGAYAYASHRWQAAEKEVKEGRLDEAQRDLDFCLLVWPRSVPVHLLAARVSRLRGDLKQAEAHLNRCLKLNHGASEEIQLEFLLLRVQTGEVDKVVDELFLYVNSGSPESPLILDTLSRAYMQNRRYGQAFACLSRWHEVAPDSPEPFRWRGWILERMSDRDGAINEYKQALERDPTYFQVRLRLAESYLERFDPVSASPLLEQLSKEFPDRADVKARLGQCRFLQGEIEEARRLLEAAIKDTPDDPTTLIYLAKIDMQATPPRSKEAEDLLRRALALDPTDVEVQHLLIRDLEVQGRSKEAHELQKQKDRDEAMLKRANETLKLDADKPVSDPKALAEVGILFLRANNERVSFYWLNRALEADPNYQPALQALVEYYEKTGQPTKAAVYRQKLKPEKTTAKP